MTRKREIQERIRAIVGSKSGDHEAVAWVALGLFTAFLRLKAVRKILRRAFDEDVADDVLALLQRWDAELAVEVKAELVAQAMRSLHNGAHSPGHREVSEFIRALQGSEEAVPDKDVPETIRRSCERFEAELPELLRDRALMDKWVVYRDGVRICDLVRETKAALLDACYEAGYSDQDLFVACVEPELLPPAPHP